MNSAKNDTTTHTVLITHYRDDWNRDRDMAKVEVNGQHQGRFSVRAMGTIPLLAKMAHSLGAQVTIKTVPTYEGDEREHRAVSLEYMTWLATKDPLKP